MYEVRVLEFGRVVRSATYNTAAACRQQADEWEQEFGGTYGCRVETMVLAGVERDDAGRSDRAYWDRLNVRD